MSVATVEPTQARRVMKVLRNAAALAALLLAGWFIVRSMRVVDEQSWRRDYAGMGAARVLRSRAADAPIEPARDLELNRSATVDSDEVTARRVGVVAGVVLGIAGEPVEGAGVELVRRPASRLDCNLWRYPEMSEECRATESGRDGRFRFDDVSTTAVFSIRAASTAAPDAMSAKVIPQVRAGDDVVLCLEAGASLAGIAIDTAGRPVAGVSVVVEAAGNGAECRRRCRATADATGAFEIRSLPPGRAAVVATTAHGNASFPKHVDLVAGDVATVTLLVDGPRRLRGIVVEDDGGKPIADASIFVSCIDEEPIAVSASDGSFEICTNEEWRESSLEVVAHGYASREFRAAPPSVDPPTIEVRLARGRKASGHLIDSRGKPLCGCLVAAAAVYRVKEGSAQRQRECVLAKTREDGAFDLADIAPDTNHVLLVRGDECASATVPFPADESERAVIDLGDIVVERGVAVSGHVVDEQGRACPAPFVRLMPAAMREAFELRAPSMAVQLHDLVELRGDADGKFEVFGLARGDWLVYATAADHLEPSVTPLQVDGLSDVVAVNCVFGGGREIVGRVRARDGELGSTAALVAEATLEAPGVARVAAQSVGADGSFHLSGLADGSYTLRIRQVQRRGTTEYRFAPITLEHVVSSPTVLDLVVSKSAELTIAVRDDADTPVPGAKVAVLDPSGALLAVGMTAADGTARFGVAADGVVRVEVFNRKSGVASNSSGTPQPDAIEGAVRGDVGTLEIRVPRPRF